MLRETFIEINSFYFTHRSLLNQQSTFIDANQYTIKPGFIIANVLINYMHYIVLKYSRIKLVCYCRESVKLN